MADRGIDRTDTITIRISRKLKERVRGEVKKRAISLTQFVHHALEDAVIRSARLRLRLDAPEIDLTKEDP